MRWSSQGSYDPRTRIAREDISLNAGGGYHATVTTTLSCPSDPWLGPSIGPGMVGCANPTFGTSGGGEYTSDWLQYLQEGFYSRIERVKESSLPNSTGFAYDRAALIAQRDRDVAAEQKALADAAEAARQKQNQHLKQAVKPAPAVVAPVITAPSANALYMQNNAVPFKILPPPGMTAVSFMLKLERRDSRGNWGLVTTLPVSAAEAMSPPDTQAGELQETAGTRHEWCRCREATGLALKSSRRGKQAGASRSSSLSPLPIKQSNVRQRDSGNDSYRR